MGKAQRVTITELARITGRSQSTWRAWLREPDCGISVELGGYRGGSREQRGRVLLIDLEDALAVHRARGGDAPDEAYLPEQSLARLEADILALRRRVRELEEIVRSGGITPPIVATRERVNYRPSAVTRASDAQDATQGGSEQRTSPYPSYTPPSALSDASAQPEEPLMRVARPTHPLRRNNRLYSTRELLPLGLVSVMGFMQEHGARESQSSTFRKAEDTGRLRVHKGDWLTRDPQVPVTRALDRAGRQRAWELWHATAWFKPCAYCPHTHDRELGAPYVPPATSSLSSSSLSSSALPASGDASFDA